MAALLGSSVRAPLTGILLAFELTNDYGMVLPLMLATGVATFVADRVDADSIYTLPLRRRGIVYAEPEDVDILQTVRVGEVMTTDAWVPADLPVADLKARLTDSRSHGFPVAEPRGDGLRLIGLVTVSDVARSDADPQLTTAGQVCTPRPVTVTPQDPVFRAMRRMASLDIGRLPVVAAEDHSELVGLVRRADVVKAYQRALTRSLGVQQRRASSRLRNLSGTQFVELVVDARAAAAGARVRDVSWPPRTILTSVRRASEIIMPDGDTVLRAGDEVVLLTADRATTDLRRLLTGSGAEPQSGG
jgi:CIC family chloride channel protein